MKNKSLSRILSIALAALLWAGSLPAIAIADSDAPLAAWGGPELAQASLVGGMNASFQGENGPLAPNPTGSTICVGQTAIGGGGDGPTWALADHKTGPISGSVSAGDVIRFSVRVYYENGINPAGMMGGAVSPDFCGFSIDSDKYDNAPLQYDDTYGYPYKELNADNDVTLDEGKVAVMKEQGLSVLLGQWRGSYENYPQTLYAFIVTNLTTGEALYHAEGEALIKNGWNQCGEGNLIEATVPAPACVGQTAIGGGGNDATWALADHKTGPISGSASAGDVIRFSVRAYYENGINPAGMMGGVVNPYSCGFSIAPEIYANAPLQYDATYGYPYKEFNADNDVTLDEGQAADLKEQGLSVLLGQWKGSYENYPQTLYAFIVTNLTTGEVLYHAEGEALVKNGWDQCGEGNRINATAYSYDTTAATSIVLNQAREYRFDTLSATLEQPGMYALSLDAGKWQEVAGLTAYQIKNGTVTPIAGAEADGQNCISFPVTTDMVGTAVTFGVTLAEGQSLTLNGVTLTRTDAPVDIERLWTAGDMAVTAYQNSNTNFGVYSEGNPGVVNTIIGYRVDGGGMWSLAGHQTGPIDSSKIEAGDLLVFSVKAYYENGIDPEGCLGASFGMAEDGSGPFFDVVADDYEEAELHRDETYGYSYKEFFTETTLTQENVEHLSAVGFKLLIGRWRGTYVDYPQTIYEVCIVNDSKDETILLKSGGTELSRNGWTQCDGNQTWLTGKTYDPAYAEEVKLTADNGEQKLGETALSRSGLFNLNLTMNEGSNGTVTAYLKQNDLLFPIASADYPAEDGNAFLSIPASGDGLSLAFSVNTAEGETIIKEAELSFERELTADEAASAAAVQAVAASIAALPSPLALTNAQAVTDARGAYDALTDAQKAGILNLAKLESAEQEIEQLETVQAVIDQIDALPETIQASDFKAITAARSAYDALTDSQKNAVTNLAKLEAAEKAMADIKAAQAVIDQIDALPTPEEAKQEHMQAADTAKEAYDALTDDQKALVTNYEKLQKVLSSLSVTLGDINGDGEINASDALIALQHSVKLTTLEGTKATAADVTRDGTIDAADALKILQFSVKLIDQF